MLVESFSGIRGIYNKDLTEDIAKKYSYAFKEFLKSKLNREPLIVIGYDTRTSNKTLKQAILESLTNVIDVGIMPVAAVELAVREYKADGGIVITASHNEPEFNGFKFLDKDGAVLRPNDINQVIQDSKKTTKIEKNEKNIINKHEDLIEKYSNFLKKIIGNFDNKNKVILDVNGGSAIILNDLLKKLNIGNVKLINEQNGKFVRKIEPNEESLKYLKEIIKKEDAEFAAGFDCDADRVEIILKDGTLVDGNYLLALIADYQLENNKGTVVINDATSNIVTRIAEKHNCKVKEVETGEINVVDEMLSLKSPVGGEGSNGGVIIPPSRCRDGILSILLILKIINKKNKPLKQLINELPKYYTKQKNIRFDKSVDNKLIKNKLKNYYLNKDSKSIIQETGDITGGLKIIIDKHNFVWFRLSKTEPNLLRIITDSNSKTESNRLLAESSSLLE